MPRPLTTVKSLASKKRGQIIAFTEQEPTSTPGIFLRSTRLGKIKTGSAAKSDAGNLIIPTPNTVLIDETQSGESIFSTTSEPFWLTENDLANCFFFDSNTRHPETNPHKSSSCLIIGDYHLMEWIKTQITNTADTKLKPHLMSHWALMIALTGHNLSTFPELRTLL